MGFDSFSSKRPNNRSWPHLLPRRGQRPSFLRHLHSRRYQGAHAGATQVNVLAHTAFESAAGWGGRSRAGCNGAAGGEAAAATHCKLHAAACPPVAHNRLLFTTVACNVAVLHHPERVVAAQGFTNCCILIRGLVSHVEYAIQSLNISIGWRYSPGDMHAMQKSPSRRPAQQAGGILLFFQRSTSSGIRPIIPQNQRNSWRLHAAPSLSIIAKSSTQAL